MAASMCFFAFYFGDPAMTKNRSVIVVSAVLALTGTVQAHTHCEMAIPADKSVLASPPLEIMVHFSEATRLTALSIQKDGDKEEKKVRTLPRESSEGLRVPGAIDAALRAQPGSSTAHLVMVIHPDGFDVVPFEMSHRVAWGRAVAERSPLSWAADGGDLVDRNADD